MQGESLIDQNKRRMRGILADGDSQRIALRLDVGERADAGPRMDHEHEPVPARIDGDNAHRKGRAKQADTAIGLGEQGRRIDERQIDAAALGDLLGQNGRARRQPQPGAEIFAGPAADDNDHVAIAAIRRRRIAGDVQADLPECLGANEVGAFRQRFHFRASP